MTVSVEAPAQSTSARLAPVATQSVVAGTAIAVIVALLAVTRADGGALSPMTLAWLCTGTAMTLAVTAWPAGLYSGARAHAEGAYELACGRGCPAAGPDDVLATPRLWRTAALLSGLVGAWALAAAGLMAVFLDNRPARPVVVVFALLGTAATSAIAVDSAARHRGAHLASLVGAQAPVAVPVRERAWRQIALPLAAAQALVNAGAAWILFHDYPVGNSLTPHVLTRSTALADAGVIVVLLSILFSVVYAGAWGAGDAALGRVELDDPDRQHAEGAGKFGPQGIVYIALAGLLFAKVVAFFLPATPTLGEVVLARAVYAAVLVFAFSGFGYVRGALNELHADAVEAS